MKKIIINILCFICLTVTSYSQGGGQSDIHFFVMVKSSNYQQDENDQLTLLNYHFFSEVFPKQAGVSVDGSIVRADNPDKVMTYQKRKNNYYYEGGHFTSLEQVDQAYPNGQYLFNIKTPMVDIKQQSLELEGNNGETEIPKPITINLYQSGSKVSPFQVNPDKELTIRWSDYSNGRADPRKIVDDMIFVVFQDCTGERIAHTGLPFEKQDYMTFRGKELVVPAGKLHAGEPYSMFVEFPHVTDSVTVNNTPGFASYATATYLDVKTTGSKIRQDCLDKMPPMDTGQTNR